MKFFNLFKKDSLKLLCNITLSSVILINCYCFLLNSCFKQNKHKQIEKEDYGIATASLYEPIDPYFLSSSLIESDRDFSIDNIEEEENTKIPIETPIKEEDIKDIMYDALNNDSIISLGTKISAEVQVTKELIELGIIETEKTNEEKLAWILENYHLTIDEFNTFKGIVLSEAGPESYIGCYAVTNTAYNRTICSRWVNEIEKIQAKGTGTNLYHQVIHPGQFSVYSSGKYLEYINETPETSPGVQAIIDFLYGSFTKNEKLEYVWNGPARLFDTLNFVGWWITPKYPYIEIGYHGNRYGVPMQESEYLSHQFTSTTQKKLEARALEAKEYTKAYKKYIKNGYLQNDAKKLARQK